MSLGVVRWCCVLEYLTESILCWWGCFRGCRQSLALCKYGERKGKHFLGLRYRFVPKPEDLVEIEGNVLNFFSGDKNVSLETRRAALVWGWTCFGMSFAGRGMVQYRLSP